MEIWRQKRRIGRILALGGLAVMALLTAQSNATTATQTAVQNAPSYIVLAWNNLGMHCYNPDFSNMAILPPYNTLRAQIIKVGDPPQFVTGGVQVEYRFPSNTYSAGKTNFWQYAQRLFHLSKPLPRNIGLTGKGLTGTMDWVADAPNPAIGHFEAQGIPLTEYKDWDTTLKNPRPYQLAEITVRDASGNVLAQTMTVTPVSSELMCVNCHADTADATTRYPIQPTGKVETNILALHDYLTDYSKFSNLPAGSTPLLNHQPVLCAGCHSDNALGATGVPGVSSLSYAMHNHHNNDCKTYPATCVGDIRLNRTVGCYNCHPGPKSKCLRCTMSQHFSLNCTTCHGNMVLPASPPGASGAEGVASSIAAGRTPWNQEPNCAVSTCHGPGYALDKPLYQDSRGHGGTHCSGCHDSPHAIAPSGRPNDGLKFVMLQGEPGTLRKCTVCHKTQPRNAFNHAWKH